MPKRKSYSNTRTSTKRRRRGGSSYKLRLRRSPRLRLADSVVPPSKMVKLKYTEFISLNAAGGGVARNVFRANSCFDPNQTGTGHQPLGYDQWSIFYDHYTVVGSKCTAQFMSQGSSASIDSCVVGIILTDNITSLPPSENLLEQPKSKHALMTTGNAAQKKTVTHGFSAKKFFGLQSIKDNRQLIGASTSTNPTEDAYFSVYQSHYDSNSILNPNEIKVIVTIEYLVYFTERKTVAGS